MPSGYCVNTTGVLQNIQPEFVAFSCKEQDIILHQEKIICSFVGLY